MQDTVVCQLVRIVSLSTAVPNKYLCQILGVLLLLVTFLIPCGFCQVYVSSVTFVRGGTFCVDCPSGV